MLESLETEIEARMRHYYRTNKYDRHLVGIEHTGSLATIARVLQEAAKRKEIIQ